MRKFSPTHSRSQKFTPALLLLLLILAAVPAAAMTLQQAMNALPEAKSRGVVGEQADGYLGVVRNEGQAAAIAKLINEARRSEYQRLARSNNISLSDVEALAGKKAIERTPAGQYIRLPSGQWQRK